MRLFFWLFVVALAACLVFSGAQALSSYLDARRIIQESVDLETPGLAEQMLQGRWRLDSGDRTRKIRERILKAAAEVEIPVDPGDVTVSEDKDGVVTVRMSWTQPMVTVRGERYLILPIAVTRTYDLAARTAATR